MSPTCGSCIAAQHPQTSNTLSAFALSYGIKSDFFTLCSCAALTAALNLTAGLPQSFQPHQEETALAVATMVFGVGEGGAIVSIADVAARVGFRLARFLREVKDASETRSSLHEKATALHDVLEAVEAAMRKRNAQVHTKPVSDDEREILVRLTAALDRCESRVKRFEEKLGGLGRGGTEPRLWERVTLQLKLDVQGPGIARVERDIQADTAVIQLQLTCLGP